MKYPSSNITQCALPDPLGDSCHKLYRTEDVRRTAVAGALPPAAGAEAGAAPPTCLDAFPSSTVRTLKFYYCVTLRSNEQRKKMTYIYLCVHKDNIHTERG